MDVNKKIIKVRQNLIDVTQTLFKKHKGMILFSYVLTILFLVITIFAVPVSDVSEKKSDYKTKKTVLFSNPYMEILEMEKVIIMPLVSNNQPNLVSTSFFSTTENNNENKEEVKKYLDEVNYNAELKKEKERQEKEIADKLAYEESLRIEKEIKYGHNNHWGIGLTIEEIDLLSRILWVEARGQCLEGQYAVVEVILNRMNSESFKGSLYEVLSANRQFSSWKLRDTAENYEDQFNIVMQVLRDEVNIIPDDIYYFATTKLTNNPYKKIGDHWFCKNNKYK